MEEHAHQTALSFGAILRFWFPLAATWLMMSVEGSLLAAVIARLPEPKANLAAYGIAFAIALIVEAPIIMIMSASTALVKDRASFITLRNFTYLLNGLLTVLMLAAGIPGLFYPLMTDLVGVPVEIARSAHHAVILLLPWPGAIGYRRFYQGILIRHNRTKMVAAGTVVRLTTMASTALVLYRFGSIPGASVGAAALSMGVIVEAVASRFMVRTTLRALSGTPGPASAPSYASIYRFYYPLALTSILAMAIHPAISFFVGHSRDAVESLAVIPVVNSFVFIFRSLGLSFQEAAIALIGDRGEGYPALRTFSFALSTAATVMLIVLAFSPLCRIWFEHVSGLSTLLTHYAVGPTRILSFTVGATVLLSLQRALLVYSGTTTAITRGTIVEVAAITTVLTAGISGLDMIGATAAAAAITAGALGENLYLLRPCLKVTRTLGAPDRAHT